MPNGITEDRCHQVSPGSCQLSHSGSERWLKWMHYDGLQISSGVAPVGKQWLSIFTVISPIDNRNGTKVVRTSLSSAIARKRGMKPVRYSRNNNISFVINWLFRNFQCVSIWFNVGMLHTLVSLLLETHPIATIVRLIVFDSVLFQNHLSTLLADFQNLGKAFRHRDVLKFGVIM